MPTPQYDLEFEVRLGLSINFGIFSYVNFSESRNFFRDATSILITTYAVPPRGRRPYTGAHYLFEPDPHLIFLQFLLTIVDSL